MLEAPECTQMFLMHQTNKVTNVLVFGDVSEGTSKACGPFGIGVQCSHFDKIMNPVKQPLNLASGERPGPCWPGGADPFSYRFLIQSNCI
jgi:hypothetical protein